MPYKTERRTKKTETRLKRKKMAQTPKGKHVSNPQQHALFGNSHSGIFQAQTSLETLKDPQRDFGPGIFHCVCSKTLHAVTSALFSSKTPRFSSKTIAFSSKTPAEKSWGFRWKSDVTACTVLELTQWNIPGPKSLWGSLRVSREVWDGNIPVCKLLKWSIHKACVYFTRKTV